MNKLLAVAGGVLLLGLPCAASAGTLFTNAVICVTPTVLDFGRVATNRTATATFVVENMGGSKLIGKATVQAPFQITAGGDYSLKPNEAQIVTITYKPLRLGPDTQTVTFTGGGGAKATVNGNVPRQPKTKSKD
jgi:hypothetical protein